ncbi:isoprenoid synthase domain-containing protein [Mycena capillaripes]|nr:isoprenoid synthase domain-containing protein [Mycena capillaripes]
MALSYRLPDLDHFPPARMHPRAKDMESETDAYFANAWPWRTSEERSEFLLSNLSGFVPCCIPDGSYDRALWINKANTLGFIVDDLIEVEKNMVFERYFRGSIEGDKEPGECEPWQNVISTILRGIKASSTGDQYPRFAQSFHECMITLGQQAPPYTNLEAYLEFRRVNAGCYWFLFMTQYALDIHLTDEELAEPKLVMCEKLCLDASTLENDVASYEKEVASGSLSNNIVATVLEHGNEGEVFVSATAVKEFIRQKIADLEVRLHGCLEDALKDSEGRSDDFRRYLLALQYIQSGNTWWSQHTKRYNIPGHPVPRKVIHLEDVGDFVEPEPTHSPLSAQ